MRFRIGIPAKVVFSSFNPLRPLSSLSSSKYFANGRSSFRSRTVLRVVPLSASHSSPNGDGFGTDATGFSGKDLKEKIERLGIISDECYTPGQYYYLLCPKCKGGRCMERSLSFHIVENGENAMWRCFHAECGWAGRTFADSGSAPNGVIEKIKSFGQLTKESLGLEPLSEKLLSYFSERMISRETLERNFVMQVAGNQAIIAFSYWRNGSIVGCKYRTMDKRYWQEKGTEKTFYGLDDIIGTDEIIIVEGEIDKLSVEEAGFRNCVSVPGGAPNTVSSKSIPSPDKDPAYKYLWSCKDYLDKASRIILATDSDEPGQALAEELARRLGKDRCWRVEWPKKDEVSYYKDANEVLKFMGRDVLKMAIDNAELYQIHSSNQEKEEVIESKGEQEEAF